MNSCENEALLSRSLDGELTQDEQRRLHAHLQECPGCRKMLSDLETMEEALRSAPAPSSGQWQARWQAVARALAVAQRQPREAPLPAEVLPLRLPRWLFDSRSRWALAIAACLLALLVGLWALESMLPAGPSPDWSVVELASADSVEVEIEQGEGGPAAVLLVSGDGEVAAVWVASEQPTSAAPES